MKFLDLLTRYAPVMIAFIVIALSFTVLFSIIFWDFPSDQKDIYYSISGGVVSILTMIVSYYFGSSHKSTNTLEK
jgi:uncharacterized membrane protein